jgi:cytochrome c peroxidase
MQMVDPLFMTTISPLRYFYSSALEIKPIRSVFFKQILSSLFFSSLLALLSAVYANSEPLKPLEEPKDLDALKVKLGDRLFHDVRLSKDNTLACAGCHNLALGGADNKALSIGIKGGIGSVNSPTVYNSGLLFRQFWDGRAETLAEQVDAPIQATVQMGSLWPEVIIKLYKDDTYVAEFSAVYKNAKEPISRKHIKDAIAEFERSLVTINSPFDRYLNGDKKAIDAQAKEGYRLFKHYGCASCHQGANVGGNMYQVFGVVAAYFEKQGAIKDSDKGRFNVTGNPQDMHRFKVPSLRMAALTAPYLHNGKAATLRDAVDIMFEHQLGRKAPDEDKDAIVHFIKTLVGEHPALKKEAK